MTMRNIFRLKQVLSLGLLLVIAACIPGSPAATVTSAPRAVIQLSADPNPIIGRICTGCGDETTTDRETVAALSIEDSGGIGGTVTLIEMELTLDSTDEVIASGQFDGDAVISIAGSNQVPASGSLLVPEVGVHYSGSEAGKAATLIYTVHFTDDLGHQSTIELAVPATT